MTFTEGVDRGGMASGRELLRPLDDALLADAERHLLSRLDLAQRELDAVMRSSWFACLLGDVQEPALRARCQSALREVEKLERELVAVRTTRRDPQGRNESAA